jgi:hypothetical protein
MKRAAAILLILIALCLAAITVLTIWPAHADPLPCGPERQMLDHLAAHFHEFVVMTGNAADQHMIVTMSSTGTYTVLLSDGTKACMILAGEKAEFDNGI